MISSEYLYNSDNEKIFVEKYIPEKVKETIIFCHGVTGCRKGRTKEDNYFQILASKLMNHNYKVILFDYSAHGDSEGKEEDVCLSKSVSELSIILEQEKCDKISFLAFSYGAMVLCNYLEKNKNINPRKIVLYSPCLFPNESCFLNKNMLFGKDIYLAYNSFELHRNGYVTVGAKNFRLGEKFIDECNYFKPDYLVNFKDKILCLLGKQDIILDEKYNETFCKKNGILMEYIDASHSLYEKIDDVFSITIKYFEGDNI